MGTLPDGCEMSAPQPSPPPPAPSPAPPSVNPDRHHHRSSPTITVTTTTTTFSNSNSSNSNSEVTWPSPAVMREVGRSGWGLARVGSSLCFGLGARSGSGRGLARGTLAQGPNNSLSLSLDSVRHRFVRLGRGRGEGLVGGSLPESGGPWIHTGSSLGSKPDFSSSLPGVGP